MMIETSWVSRCLAQCLGCSLHAEWVNEWKDRQDGTVVWVWWEWGGCLEVALTKHFTKRGSQNKGVWALS